MRISFLMVAGLGLALAGCGGGDATYLVFGQQTSVGLTIGSSGPQQEVELVLGYKSKDVAVVPVSTGTGPDATVFNGETTSTGADNPGMIKDALSTFGQFGVTTGNTALGAVGLEQFFATGNAAQVLAQGFANKLANSAVQRPAAPTATR